MIRSARRFDHVQLSLIRRINALATPLSINLGIGEPNVAPDAEFLEMARGAVSEPWAYSANAGLLDVRKALAAAVGQGYDPGTEICLTAGTQEALYAVIQAFVNPGNEVLVPNPGFLAYATVTELAGGVPRPYPLDLHWQIDVEALRQSITDRTVAIIVNSPSNPTGAVIPDSQLKQVVELAKARDILVISDEVYREIHYGDHAPATLKGAGRNVIVMDGLSKSHAMTGLRLGWILADAELMLTIVKAHQYIATCASVFSQQLAKRIFDNQAWNRRWLTNVRAQFQHQRDTALAACEQRLHQPLEVTPEGAFYVFVPVPSCDTVQLAEQLATEAAVLAIPGVAFGSQGEGHLRISYATSEENITRGLARIGEYLDRLDESKKSC